MPIRPGGVRGQLRQTGAKHVVTDTAGVDPYADPPELNVEPVAANGLVGRFSVSSRTDRRLRRMVSSIRSVVGGFVFERVKKLEQLVADPFAIAPAADPCRNKHLPILQLVESGASCSRCDAVTVSGDFGADNWLRRQAEDDLPGD